MTLTPEQQDQNRKMVEAQIAGSGMTYDAGSTVYVNGVGYRLDGSLASDPSSSPISPITVPLAVSPEQKALNPTPTPAPSGGLSGGNPVGDNTVSPALTPAPTTPAPVNTNPPLPPGVTTTMYGSLADLQAQTGRGYIPGDRIYGVAPFSAPGWAAYIEKQRNNIELFDYSLDWARYDKGLEMRPETGYTGPTGPSNAAIAMSQALTAGGNALTAAQAESIAGLDVGYRGSYGGAGGAAASNLAATIQAATAALSAPAPTTQPKAPIDPLSQSVSDVVNRPGFTDISSLGDINTSNLAKEILSQGGAPDIVAATGLALERQRQAALATSGTRDDQFFANELQKWTENKIELSSAYHNAGKEAGVPVAANPFEYAGDLALALQKAGNPKDFTPQTYGFNKGVSDEISLLTGGKGLQETSWDVAKTGQPAMVSFEPAIQALNAADGLYGVYGNLSGGKQDTRSAFEGLSAPSPLTIATPTPPQANLEAIGLPAPFRSTLAGSVPSQGNNPLVPSVSAAGQEGATGGMQVLPKPFLSTFNAAPAPDTSLFGTIGKGIGDFQKDVSDKIYSGYGSLFGLTGEQAKLGVKSAGTIWETMGNVAPNPTNLGLSFGVGALKDTMDQPVKAAVTTAIGFGMGAGFKALDVVGAKAAAISVEEFPLITKGFSAFTGAVPTILGGLYAADVGIRSTSGLTNFSPGSIASKLGGITATEITPLTIGGMGGYKAAESVFGRMPSLTTLPGETQIIAGAKPEDVQATKATLDIFKNINRVESPMKNSPDLSKVSGVQDNAAGIEKIISTQDPTVYGRSVEIGQMPEDWIALRGTTKDVDYFTPRPSEAGKAIAEAYPQDYVPKDNTDYTALMSPKTGQTALDIHPYPEGYAGGKVGLEAPTSDYVKARVNPIPDDAGILNTEGLPQEKLYVQARRKATSVLGEETGQFGPPEHRMKDVVDLMNYSSYLGKETSGMRRTALENSFGILKDYYTKPENFGNYLEGEKYADIIKNMEFGKPTEGMTVPKGTGFEDVRFSSVPEKSPMSVYPSTFGMSTIPSIISPWILPKSPSTVPRSVTPSSPVPSPTQSPSLSQSPSPFSSLFPSLSPAAMPSSSTIPTGYSPQAISPSPKISSYVPQYTPSSPPIGNTPISPYSPSQPGKTTPSPSPYPWKDTPSITPPPPGRTPSPTPWKDTPSITPPPPPSPTPTPTPWHEYPPPPPPPKTPGLPGFTGGNPAFGRPKSPWKRSSVTQWGLDVATFGATRPTLAGAGTYRAPRGIPKQQKAMQPSLPKLPDMPGMKPKRRRK
jgi:hypothetical protein